MFGERKNQNRRAVPFGERQKFFEAFGLRAYRINQRTTGEIFQARFQCRNVAGVDSKGRVGYLRDFADSFSHHRRLVYSADAHIDIEDLRTRLDLIKRVAFDAQQRAFANFGGKFLSAGRIDSFANQRR